MGDLSDYCCGCLFGVKAVGLSDKSMAFCEAWIWTLSSLCSIQLRSNVVTHSFSNGLSEMSASDTG